MMKTRNELAFVLEAKEPIAHLIAPVESAISSVCFDVQGTTVWTSAPESTWM